MASAIESDRQTIARQLAELGRAEDLINRLHAEAEAQRQALARTLHDDMGALLVSSAMDLILVQKRASELNLVNLGPLDRSAQSLQSAIQMGRELVEQLRPSILDNFGLFAALKWHLKRASAGSSAQLTETYPLTEPQLQPEAVATLFRVAEEAINMIFKRHGVLAADVNLKLKENSMTMKFSDNGVPELIDGVEAGLANALASMQHRIRALGGTIVLAQSEEGTVLEALVPLKLHEPPAR